MDFKKKMMSTNDSKLSAEEKALKEKLHLANLSYDQATCPSEFIEAYRLYVEAYSAADRKACKNAIEICDLFSFDYDDRMYWKVKEYELGDKEAGQLAATYFYKGLCNQRTYGLYFENLARKLDPLALCVMATAFHMGYGCEVNKDIARIYETKLIEVLTGKNCDLKSSGGMFSCVCTDEEAADMVLNYLSGIGEASKHTVIAKFDGNQNFMNTAFEVSRYLRTDCYIKFDGKYYDMLLLAGVSVNRRLHFERNTEITFASIGKNHHYFLTELQSAWHYWFEPVQDNNTADSNRSETENLSKKVDECWALYDQGRYDEAYKMVLPIAKKGYGKAINMMGMLYVGGKGFPVNPEKAMEWYELGMKKGFSTCFSNMGNLFYNYSVDEKQGKIAAYRYYKEVIGKVNKTVAKRGLEILLSGLVPYSEDEKQQWIKRLRELGEDEYLKSLFNN